VDYWLVVAQELVLQLVQVQVQVQAQE